MKALIRLADQGRLPDPLIRLGIKFLDFQRLAIEEKGGVERQLERKQRFIEEMRRSPIAMQTDMANAQHYELPSDFFRQVLGAHMKYSGCYWPEQVQDLDDAETQSLELVARRAQIFDGLRVLELGCGWGSFSLWASRRFPNSRFTAVSNAASQGEFIEEQCRLQGIANLEVLTADMNLFEPAGRFDRVVSIEMFEHMRNWERLLARISTWLNTNGRVFIHLFSHKDAVYPYEVLDEGDWMGRYFFTGGMMPSDDLMLYFQKDLVVNMNDTTLLSKHNRIVRASRKPTTRLAKNLFLKLLSKIETGQVTVREKERTDTFGKATPDFPLTVTITIHNPKAYTRIAFGGSIGAAEAYMLQYWDVDDLTALVRIVIRNQILLKDLDSGPAKLASPLYKAFHFLRRNTKSGSRKNIVDHYDLGNNFYRLFLDETMTYSSAVFERPEATLKEASNEKYDRICRKLQLSEKDHVLEIGTGWGGFTLHAVKHYGCRVTTTTISDEQYRLAKARFEAAGIMDRVVLLKSDYRELQGRYDKLVSIEMIEAVGHQFLETFMARCAGLLKPDGVMALQAITIADWAFEEHKKGVDFIKRYIFPGSCIPSLTAISQAASRATDLRLYHLEDITPHYAETLRRWRHNFINNIEKVRSLGFSEIFNRMWEFYLRYCEAGFEERFLGDVQLVMTKPLARMPAIGWPNRKRR